MANQRLVQIDALRGLAALLVVVTHFTEGYGREIGWLGREPLLSLAMPRAGVALFFVISGFVILMTLERTSGPLAFARARFARLYPAYFASMILIGATIVVSGFNWRDIAWTSLPANIAMIAPLAGQPTLEPTYWTLTREILFYALSAAVVFSFGQQRLVAFAAAWIVAAAAANVLIADRNLYIAAGPASFAHILLNFQFAHLFVAGMMLYLINRGDRPGPAIFVLVMAMLESGFSDFGLSRTYAWKAIPATLVYAGIVHAAARGMLPLLGARPLLFLGAISYSLYLLHQTIGFLTISRLTKAGIAPELAIASALAMTVILATLMKSWVEDPWQARLRQSRTRIRPTLDQMPTDGSATVAGSVDAARVAAATQPQTQTVDQIARTQVSLSPKR